METKMNRMVRNTLATRETWRTTHISITDPDYGSVTDFKTILLTGCQYSIANDEPQGG